MEYRARHYSLAGLVFWLGSIHARGPQGEKRPAEVIGAAVMVDKIATGEKILALKTTRRGGIERQRAQRRPHSPSRT